MAGEPGSIGVPVVTGTRLGVLFGHAVPDEAFRDAAEPCEVATPYGERTVLDGGDVVALRRHGHDTFVPAHLIDHRANVAALALAGCDRVVAVGSVGSLRLDWPVGTVVCPDDVFAPWVTPSYHDDAAGHRVPGFHPAWRRTVLDTWNDVADVEAVDGGVYAQTVGPRFETPAEVRFLATHADLVGMTIAAELVLAGEAGLAFAAVCSVDNLGNGLAAEPLTVEEFRAGKAANEARISAALERLVRRLVARPA